MPANILDVRELSKSIRAEIKEKVAFLIKKPRIDFVYFDDDKSTELYFTHAKKMAGNVGMIGELHKLGTNTTEKDFITLIEYLNEEKDISGIMLQMPLPKHIRREVVYETISTKKDIDAISNLNLGRILTSNDELIPCTVRSVMTILEHYNIKIEGANAVVVGRSEIVGKPLALSLLNKSATVTIAHSKTKDLKNVCKNADILCVSIGKAEFIDAEYIKENAVVIDIGINVLEDGSIKGDVKFDEAVNIASMITPVPNGVGSLTTTMLLSNLLYLHTKYNNN